MVSTAAMAVPYSANLGEKFPTGEMQGHKIFDAVLFAPLDQGIVAEIVGVKLIKADWVVQEWKLGYPFPSGIFLGTFDWTGIYLKDVWLRIDFRDMQDTEVVVEYLLRPGVDRAEFWYIASNLIADEKTLWLTPTGAVVEPTRLAKLAPPQQDLRNKVLQLRKNAERKLATTWSKIRSQE